MAEPSSAIVVRFRLPAGLGQIRQRHDAAARRGVPPHVTILYTFVAREDLTEAVRLLLSAIAGEIRTFEVRFESVARWPDAVYSSRSRASPSPP